MSGLSKEEEKNLIHIDEAKCRDLGKVLREKRIGMNTDWDRDNGYCDLIIGNLDNIDIIAGVTKFGEIAIAGSNIDKIGIGDSKVNELGVAGSIVDRLRLYPSNRIKERIEQ